MKHLPDLLTLQHRHPLFRMSVHSSVRLSTFMSKFDIYVKISILINYKTEQPSNLAWNISLTSRLCDIGARFSIRLSVGTSVCLLTVLLCRSSTFTSKLVFLSTTILQQPSYLAWHISLTSWLGRYVDPVTLTYMYILRSIDFDTIYVDVRDLLTYKAYNYQTLHSASSRCTDLAGTLTRWPWPIFCAPVTLTYFALTFDISSTIRPTTIKPCKLLLLNVLTWQIPWPGDLDLYFGCSDFDIIYVNIPDLLKCKTSSHQTLHSASPRCTDSAGILTQWPWPIFCAPVPFAHFMSTFNISSTIRPTTTKPCIMLLLNVQTLQVPWLGDLDLYIVLHWLLHLLRHPSICPQL